MNKRIRELAEQAGILYKQFGPSVETRYTKKKEQDLAKFAELIVKEHLGIWDLMDNGNDVEGYIEMEDYPNAIIKHFGVENKENT